MNSRSFQAGMQRGRSSVRGSALHLASTFAVALVAICAGVVSVEAAAPEIGSGRRASRIELRKADGQLKQLLALRASPADLNRYGGRVTRLLKSSGEVNVTITFVRELSPLQIDHYEDMGVRFMRLPGGELSKTGRFYPAWVSEHALAQMNDDPDVAYIHAGSSLQAHKTMDQSIPEIQADIRHGLPTGSHLLGNKGQGTAIANFDTGIDIFHPDFFRPQTGLFYDWIDADGNGLFSYLVDCVDMNRSGSCDGGESLGMSAFPFQSGINFDPKEDWLFLDANGNGQRDYGPSAGYTDADPCFGELIFIANDANNNHILDEGERLTPLGPSKVRAMITYDDDNNAVEYLRGVNLIHAPVDPDGHGTSVSSILVAQDHGYNRSFVGVAPAADLLVIDRVSSPNHINDISWAKSHGAGVMLWEFGAWINKFLDGSSPLEQAITEDMLLNRCVHVTPNGNLGASEKHAAVSLTGTGDSESVSFHIPAGFNTTLAHVTVLWQGNENDVDVSIKQSTEQSFTELTGLGFTFYGQGQYFAFPQVRATSTNGTSKFYAGLNRQGATLASNTTWDILVTSNAGPVQVHLYVADSASSWTGGVTWTEFTTPSTTLTYPATADVSLSVGSYTVASGGFLSGFSGRGPRIDGESGLLDITAPGHHDITCATSGFGQYWAMGTTSFGGTSAAGPHAAAAAALLMSAVPSASPLEVLDAIADSAATDVHTGNTPNEDWGYGKLRIDDAYRLLADRECIGIFLSNVSPPNGATGLDPDNVSYGWTDDPNADRYDLLIGTTNPPTQLIPNLVVNQLFAGTRQPSTTYYWQLIARNTCGFTTVSEVMSYTTAGVATPEIAVSHEGLPLAGGSIVTATPVSPGEQSIVVLRIENSGTAPLEFDIATSGDLDAFTLPELNGGFLSSQQSINVDAVFAPPQPGEYELIVEFISNDEDEGVHTITLRGEALVSPALTLDVVDLATGVRSEVGEDDTVTFPDTATTSSSEVEFEITNTGDAPLTLTGIEPVSIGGDHPDEFILDQVPFTPIAPGATAAMRVEFAPLETGVRSAAMTILSDDPDRSVLSVTLGGFGVDDIPEIDCNGNGEEDFSDIVAGDSTDCNENQTPDECEPDSDGDGVIDDCDTCDGADDTLDTDADGTPDCRDNCPQVANSDQLDSDADGTGDACDQQQDIVDCNGNNVPDSQDINQATSSDCNLNAVPDECESDADGDSVIDDCDACAGFDDLADADGDGVADCLDNCPSTFNPDQFDADTDGIGDACADDGEPVNPDCNANGFEDTIDLSTGLSDDCNGNGRPDECESDRDKDGVIDACDACPNDDRNNCGFAAPPGFCGVGGLGMLPVMMLGLCGTRASRRRVD